MPRKTQLREHDGVSVDGDAIKDMDLPRRDHTYSSNQVQTLRKTRYLTSTRLRYESTIQLLGTSCRPQ